MTTKNSYEYTNDKATEIAEAVQEISVEFNNASGYDSGNPNYPYMVGYLQGIIRTLLETTETKEIESIIASVKSRI